MSELRERLVCETGFLAIAGLDVDSSASLSGLVVGIVEREMWRHRILMPILVGVADGLCPLDTIAFNDHFGKCKWSKLESLNCTGCGEHRIIV